MQKKLRLIARLIVARHECTYVRYCKENAPIYMYYIAPETPMMSSVIADCPDLAPPQYFGQVYAYGAAPEYLRDCCTGTHSPASGLQLRSLERTDLRVRRMKTHFGDRAFSAAGPRCWNSLPPVIRFADSVDSFKAQLKTHLFAKAYPM